jgi:hypothetical protein
LEIDDARKRAESHEGQESLRASERDPVAGPSVNSEQRAFRKRVSAVRHLRRTALHTMTAKDGLHLILHLELDLL